jgi:26S proteasome regulatory subunit N10
LVELGKKLKQANIAVDIVNFGEEAANTPKLEAFMAAVNNNDTRWVCRRPPSADDSL